MNGLITRPDPEEAQYFKFLTFRREQFTITWFYRAFAYTGDVPADNKYYSIRNIDVADRFISLWICFNSILRTLYGEDKADWQLIVASKKDKLLWQTYFDTMSDREFNEHLNSLKQLLPIKDMKNGKFVNMMKDNFSNLITVIYQVRNNLFHGRKSPDDTNTDDFYLIKLSYFLLAPLVIEYVRDKGLIATCVHPEFEIEHLEKGIDFTG